ncbi:MAG: 4Fe-4S dicluster domain-containing protein [Ignavibacteriales bacterium]
MWWPSDSFYSDQKCLGCGTCERVCLSGRVWMVDKKPVWDGKVRCYTCRACLNYCPAQ